MDTRSATNELSRRLDELDPDAPQHVPGLTVIPLLSRVTSALPYRSMKAAIAAGDFVVRETSEGGSVPQLVVENGGDPVLLLDGEEVAGAKQNRILNSSILVDARGRLVVPVSCTEAGRWNYASQVFTDSGYVAPYSVRNAKSRSVHMNLRADGTHASDQMGVWRGIDDYHRRAGTRSSTAALRDAMEQRRGDMAQALEKITRVEGQVGLVVVTADGFVALDAVSRPEVYADLHDRLVRSYVAEVVAGSTGGEVQPDGRVDAFLERLRAAGTERYRSPGMGEDLRAEGKGVRGAGLLVQDEVVHLGAFSEPEAGSGAPDAVGHRLHRRHWRI